MENNIEWTRRVEQATNGTLYENIQDLRSAVGALRETTECVTPLREEFSQMITGLRGTLDETIERLQLQFVGSMQGRLADISSAIAQQQQPTVELVERMVELEVQMRTLTRLVCRVAEGQGSIESFIDWLAEPAESPPVEESVVQDAELRQPAALALVGQSEPRAS